MIAIIGAMQEEVNEVLKLIHVNSNEEICGYTFTKGTYEGKEIVVLKSGIGKVNAAVSTTLLLDHYAIDYVINVGTAGGLHIEQNPFDVVISTGVAHHDVDVRVFDYKYGQVPGMPYIYECDVRLINEVKRIVGNLNLTYQLGLIVSGDQFISTDKQVSNIKEYFSDALCAEMEAGAIAQVCYQFKKPFIITRSLSDVFGKGDNSIQFDQYLEKASKSSATMCLELVKSL